MFWVFLVYILYVNSRVLRCGACGREVQVSDHDPQRVYRCQTCSGILLVPGVTTRRRVPAGTRFGRYQLVNVIVRGARGVVYRALDTEKLRLVALKQITSPEFLADAAEVTLWVERVRPLAELNHPALARVYEVGIEGGVPYLTMALVEGVSLQLVAQSEPVGLFPLLGGMRELARAVAYLHEKGFVHGRITSEHCILTEGGGAAIVSLDQAVRGGDPRADLRPLGKFLYELVVRKPAEPPRPPRELGVDLQRDLEHLVLRAARGEYPGAAELASDIELYLSGKPVVRDGASRALPEA